MKSDNFSHLSDARHHSAHLAYQDLVATVNRGFTYQDSEIAVSAKWGLDAEECKLMAAYYYDLG